MELYELIQALKVQSIADLFEPDADSIWRWYCRNYSKAFFTPLYQVMNLDPQHVILSVLENNLEPAGGENLEDNVEDLLERVYAIEDPTYESMKRKELEEIDSEIERIEALRIKENRPIHKSLKVPDVFKKTLLKEEKVEAPKIPPSGGINLSYLAEQDSEGGGFKD